MNIDIFPVGELQANCYFITEGNDLLIIDPGDQAAFLLEEMSRRNLHLVGIVATHGHFDHIMAVGEIQMSFDLPLHISKEDMFLVQRLGKTAHHFLRHNSLIVEPKKVVDAAEGPLTIGPFQLEIIHTPGHTPGSTSFYIQEENALFTGDTVFKGSVGDYSHSYSDKHDLFESLGKLERKVGEAALYPGHGEPSLLREELKHYHRQI